VFRVVHSDSSLPQTSSVRRAACQTGYTDRACWGDFDNVLMLLLLLLLLCVCVGGGRGGGQHWSVTQQTACLCRQQVRSGLMARNKSAWLVRSILVCCSDSPCCQWHCSSARQLLSVKKAQPSDQNDESVSSG